MYVCMYVCMFNIAKSKGSLKNNKEKKLNDFI